jgi:DNA topoisomerase-1
VGSNYIVEASVGHIMDLDNKKLSVDVNNKFEPTYIESVNKKKVISKLRKLAKQTKNVLIATDMDREGEMIGWSIAYILKLKNPKRIVFYEITKDKIKKALKTPVALNYDLINASKARRILDRIVGYELSPVLWSNFKQGQLSAGRVQSAVVRLIADKETEINNFFASDALSHFKITGTFLCKKSDDILKTTLYEITKTHDDGAYHGKIAHISNIKKSKKLLKKIINAKFKVANIVIKKSIRNPSPPFTTYSLQQDANSKLRFATKRTMGSAQRLYEGGYITYMRTDSVNLSEDALKSIEDYVISTFGEKYHNLMRYKTKTKNAQEAHEAIRPSDIVTTEVKLGGKIGPDEIKLYNLIWRRTIASQMSPAKFDITTIQISINKTDIDDKYFSTSVENLKFPGFLKVYGKEEEDENPRSGTHGLDSISVLTVGTKLKQQEFISKQDYDKPVPRYNEGTLVNKLKNLNIGRPATIANIIDTIQKRKYVKIDNIDGKKMDALILSWSIKNSEISEDSKEIVIGKDNTKLIPTGLGIMINNFLVENFPDTMKYQFTSEMEENLDLISNGDKVWYKVLKNFYKKFHPMVKELTDKTQNNICTVDKFTKVLGKDPKTGDDVVAKFGKWGAYVVIGENKNKSAPIKDPLSLETITLKQALKLLKYPKELGEHNNVMIYLKKGEFGYYVQIGSDRVSVEDNKVTLKDIPKILKANDDKNKEREKKVLKVFTTNTKIYTIRDGEYGRFINARNINNQNSGKNKWGVNTKIYENIEINDITLEKVVELVNNKYTKQN